MTDRTHNRGDDPVERTDVNQAWAAYLATSARADELLERDDELAAELAEATAELAARRQRAAEAESEIGALHSEGMALWTSLVKRVGSGAAGEFPSPVRASEGKPETHLARVQRLVTGPIRFPLVAPSMRTGAWGLVGGSVCCALALVIVLVTRQVLPSAALHVVQPMIFLLGLVASPVSGFLAAWWWLDRTSEDDEIQPARVGFVAGGLAGVVWLAVEITQM